MKKRAPKTSAHSSSEEARNKRFARTHAIITTIAAIAVVIIMLLQYLFPVQQTALAVWGD